MASGVLVFRTLGEALKAGFQIYDRTPNGYIARAKINGYWQMALIELI
jgi:Ca2+-binding EF-hand superfamily protein